MTDTPVPNRRRRNAVSIVLAVVSVVALVLSVLGVWGSRTALNTDVFVSRVGPLVGEPAVAEALSDYLTTEVVQTLDIEEFLSENLPPRAQVLARPLTGAITAFVSTEVQRLIQSERFEAIWTRILSGAHEALVELADEGNTIITTSDDGIEVNMLPAIGAVLTSVAGVSPELTTRIDGVLESLANDPPEQAIAALEKATGITLPDTFGVVTIDDNGTLATARNLVGLARTILVALVLLCAAATVGSIVAAPNRRRRTIQLLAAWALTMAVLRQLVLWLADRLASGIRNPIDRAAAEAVTEAVVQGLVVAAAVLLFVVIAVAIGLWVLDRQQQVVALTQREKVPGRWWLPRAEAVWPIALVVAVTAALWLLPASLALTLGLLLVLLVGLAVVWSNGGTPDLR